MKAFLLRILRSPRLGWVVVAVSAPALVTIPFAPVWAIGLAFASCLAAIGFMYAVVLSPKYVHSPDAAHPAAFYKDAATSICTAQAEIRDALELATSSALDLGHRLQNLQVNHDAQVHLAKDLLSRSDRTASNERTLADLTALSADLLKKQNAQFKGIVETSVSMIKQLQINAIDAGHPEDVGELQALVTTLRKALDDATEEVVDLNEHISDKLAETKDTLDALDELTEDTNGQVRDAVIAMQYHDITTQKLAAVDRVHLAGLQERTLEKLSRISPGEVFKPPLKSSSPMDQLVQHSRVPEAKVNAPAARVPGIAPAMASETAPGKRPARTSRQESAVELFD